MARIHGEIKIMRRPGQPYKKTYNLFKNDLRQDFQCLCGYCGKDLECFKEDNQIDHFVPKSLDPKRIGDYYNLVYACKQCNRAKWDKWPTKDITKPNDGKVGFIDPVTNEYDKHVGRQSNGMIFGITSVGKYMVHELNLDIRPTRKIWLIMQLYYYKHKFREYLKENKGNIDSKQYELYITLDDVLEKYLNYFYSRR